MSKIIPIYFFVIKVKLNKKECPSTGYPPTLIQGGTREIFLSEFIRLYQALDQTDIPVKLDIYEGMPHVHQIFLYKTPESEIALSKMNDFLKTYLNY
jgi:monoterpene epsilon-lactone hydrolase